MPKTSAGTVPAAESLNEAREQAAQTIFDWLAANPKASAKDLAGVWMGLLTKTGHRNMARKFMQWAKASGVTPQGAAPIKRKR